MREASCVKTAQSEAEYLVTTTAMSCYVMLCTIKNFKQGEKAENKNVDPKISFADKTFCLIAFSSGIVM